MGGAGMGVPGPRFFPKRLNMNKGFHALPHFSVEKMRCEFIGNGWRLGALIFWQLTSVIDGKAL